MIVNLIIEYEIHNPDRTYPDLIQSIRNSYAVVTLPHQPCTSNYRR